MDLHVTVKSLNIYDTKFINTVSIHNPFMYYIIITYFKKVCVKIEIFYSIVDRMFPRHLTGEDLKGITDTHKTQLKIMEKTLEDEEEKERQKMIKEGKKKMNEKKKENASENDENEENRDSDEGLS